MNIEANAVQPAAELPRARTSSAQRFLWSVRRELWENRSIYLAPLIVAALLLIGFSIRLPRLPSTVQAAATLDPMKRHDAIVQHYDVIAALLMATMIIVSVFYCLDALYAERRDRSILFWKSLPVSDATTVLAKASVPYLVLPLLAVAITILAQFIALLMSSAVLAASGLSASAFWSELSFGRMSLLLLYHVFMVHVLWNAPLYGWMLLVSAWARRAPFLWAFLPPVALCYLEKIAFNSTHFLAMLEYRFFGPATDAVIRHGAMPMDTMTRLTPGRFLATPGLWTGLALTAVFLAAAVRLRRYRAPV